MGSIMAKLTITNKKKPVLNLKSFKCYIARLCTVTALYPNTLFHDGEGPLPSIGDKVYSATLDTLNPYELFTNRTGALPNYSFMASLSKNYTYSQEYFITDGNGIVTNIVDCSKDLKKLN